MITPSRDGVVAPPFPVSLSRFASAQRPIHSLQRQIVYDGNRTELIEKFVLHFDSLQQH